MNDGPSKNPAVRLVESDLKELEDALAELDAAGQGSGGLEQLSDQGQALTYIACILRNIQMRAQSLTTKDCSVLTVVGDRMQSLTLPVRYEFLLKPAITAEVSILQTKKEALAMSAAEAN